MRKHLLLSVMLCLCAFGGARAQYASAALGAAGLGIHFFGHDAIDVPVRNYIQDNLRQGGSLPVYNISDYAQYAPEAMHLGLGLLGAPAEHSVFDRAIEASIAYAFTYGAGYLLKLAFHTQRPDGSDFKSFPSGHTSIAFTGAELVRLDYGWGWGGGAYALAVFTGAERLWADEHWLSDVLAGAGFGILCANAGRWLLEPVKSLLNLPELEWDGLDGRPIQLAVQPAADFFSGIPTAKFSIIF